MSDQQPAIERQQHFYDILGRLHKDGHLTKEEWLMLASLAEREWDDAIHIAAPWGEGVSVCGEWQRNLVPFTGPPPDGMEGCWQCLLIAEWINQHIAEVM